MRERKKSKLAVKVLRESFGVQMNLDRLNVKQTSGMLQKIRGLLSETKNSSRIHSSHKNPDYLKLLMMEQALSGHLNDLRAQMRIVVENEEVQKSQVILAAQDMIDSIQKMLEQISKMNVEELPAVVDGISNEIGANESEQFNSSASEALNSLQQALTTTKQGLQSALGTITGQGGGEMAPMGGMGPEGGEGPMPGEEELGLPGEEEMGAAPGGELPELPEEPEEGPGNSGRERR